MRSRCRCEEEERLCRCAGWGSIQGGAAARSVAAHLRSLFLPCSLLSLQYASIGWSVGATLGICAALKENESEGTIKKRPVLFCGDGAFQVGKGRGRRGVMGPFR